jgi:hypothetical protein
MVFIGLLSMFENKELSGVNGATRGEVKGRRENETELRNKEFHNL